MPYLKVVGVMGGRNFHNARTLCHICMFIANNGDFFIEQGQDYMTAVQMLVSFVLCVNGNRRIAQHGFGTGCGKFKLFSRFLNGVKEMPEIALFFIIFNLCVGYRGVTARTPVHHTVAPVNQVFFIKTAEHLIDRFVATLVKGKAFSVPIAGRAHFFKLFNYSAAVLGFPIPRALQEFFTPQILFGDAFFPHCLHDFCLGGNRRMVSTGKPQRIISCHTVIAD